MNRLFLPIILIVLLSITITVGVLKPGINKPVRFSMTNFEIENTETAVNNTKHIEINNIDDNQKIEKTIITQDIETKKIDKNIKIENNIKSKTVETKLTNNNILKKDKAASIPQNSKTKEKEIKITLPNSINNTIKQKQKEPMKQAVKPIDEPVIQIKETDIENKPLTEQEEIIVWNKWRSNLQNQIMYDTKIAAPIGTRFKFSFTVDKAGRISNLMVWCDTPAYNAIASNQLKPLIASYQGKAVLKFPPRTKRIFTNVTGGFAISTANKYSTPDDYSDIEKVR